MKDQSEKIEIMANELHQLGLMYHKLTDEIGEFFTTTEIVQALQKQIALLTGKLSEARELQEAYEAELRAEDAQEFDKYRNY